MVAGEANPLELRAAEKACMELSFVATTAPVASLCVHASLTTLIFGSPALTAAEPVRSDCEVERANVM